MAIKTIILDHTLNITPCQVNPGDTIQFETKDNGIFRIKFEKDTAFSSPLDITVTNSSPGSQLIDNSALTATKFYGVGFYDGSIFKVAAPPRIIITTN